MLKVTIIHEKKKETPFSELTQCVLAGWLAGEGALDAMCRPHGTVG